LYVKLPARELAPLADLPDLPRGKALRILSRYMEACETLAEAEDGRELGAVNLESVFFDEEERLYFLPLKLEELQVKNLPAEEQERGFRRWSDPALEGSRAAAYQCAALLFGILTGSHPKSREEPVALHPHLFRADLRPQWADALHAMLAGTSQLSMTAVHELLLKLRSEEAWEAPEEGVREERLQAAERHYRRHAASIRRSRRIKRSAPALLLSAAAIGVLLLLLFPVWRGDQRSAIEGLSQAEVIRLFYRSHNNLDHPTLAECTQGRAASGHMHEVTTLFVINRIRRGVEGITPFMSVEEWKEQGRPAPGRDTFVFGVDGLQLRQLGEQLWEAEYNKYTTLPPERPDEQEAGDRQELEEEARELQSTGRVRSFRVRERIRMERSEEGWKISAIETLERTRREP
jgi:hypothetical protein